MRRLLPLLLVLTAIEGPARASMDEAGDAWARDTKAVCAATRTNPLSYSKTDYPAAVATMSDLLDSKARHIEFSWAIDPKNPPPSAEAVIRLPDSEGSDDGIYRFQTVSPEYTRGTMHLYTSEKTRQAPLILMFPITGEQPYYQISRFFCKYFFKKGFRCAVMERELPAEEDLPKTLDGLFQLPGLPPYSVVRARHALDALEEMGELSPGDRVGVAGLSLGAIDAALIATVDPRVQAATLMLGGADIPLILRNIHGLGVDSFAHQREAQEKANGWNDDQFQKEMGPRTCVGDPLTYLDDRDLIKNPNLRSGSQFLMINVKGDPAIPDSASEELYRALCELDGKCPDRKVYNTWFLPKRTRHVFGGLLHIFGARKAALKHFRKELLHPSAPAPAPAARALTDNRF